MRKVLLLEADSNAGEDILDAAKSLGVTVFVATHEDLLNGYHASLKAKINGFVLVNFADTDRCLQQLITFCQENRIEGVLAGHEFMSAICTRLAARLGLPSHDPELADACRKKDLMAQAFQVGSVPAPKTICCDTAEEALHEVEKRQLAYPLVVKPCEDCGSVNVSVVQNRGELERAFKLAQSKDHSYGHKISLKTTVLVQEYIGGEEFSVETAIHKGGFRHLSITEKFTTKGSVRAELGHTVPAELSPHARQSIISAVESALRSLGLRNGVSHTELKLFDGEVKIIEVGARLPGDYIVRLIEHSTGVSMAKAYVQAALGETPDTVKLADKSTAVRFITSEVAGTFEGLRGIGVVRECKSLISSEVYVRPGDVLSSPTDNIARIGYIMVRENSPADTNRVAAQLMNTLRVEVA